jgi:protein TonB
MIEVKIAVDQRGRVVQAETDKPGDTANEICLAQAALKAAYGTRFNADYNAPVRQIGSITYHFIPQ